jgi:ABC-type oligopeptide transport system substrate-binding subunit
MRRNAASIIFAATILGALCAAVPASANPGEGAGTIRGWCHSEYYTDPKEIEEGIVINAILEIDAPVRGERYIVTDESGLFALEAVPAGEYVLHPLHCPARYSVKVEVTPNEISGVTVLTPDTGLELYLINCAVANPPLANRNVRRALALAVDRERLLADAGVTDRAPAFSFIPEALREGGWADGAARLSCSPVQAMALLEDAGRFDLMISYNISETHGKIAAGVRSYLEALPQLRKVTLVGKEWAQHVQDYLSGSFELLRMGWMLDSNNILEYYKVYFGEGNLLNYSSAEVLALLRQAQGALDDRNIPAYQEAVLAINDILVTDMPAIPLHYYQ